MTTVYLTILTFLLFSVIPIYSQDCELEKQLFRDGLVDIKKIDSTIQVEIINATKNNILGVNSYGCLTKCYLQPDVAAKVASVQKLLKVRYPGYSLKILEGTRPRRVQKKMYDLVKNTSLKKFVADPLKGSMHNYGAAIDLTILDNFGKELDMGKPDPRIKIAGKSELEIKIMFALNRISKKQKSNRKILNELMTSKGFIPVSYEWWHFDGFEKTYIRKTYKIVE